MNQLSDGQSEAAAAPKRRRLAAPLLSLLAPGLGQLAVGHPRRAVVWWGGYLALVAGVVAAMASGRPRAMWVFLCCVLVWHLASVVDTLRLARSAVLPRARAIALIALGMLTFDGILSHKVRANVVEAFQIPSASMWPTLQVGDKVVVAKGASAVARGQVVVHRHPHDPGTTYVKRIVALAGDVVEISRGHLFVNGADVTVREDPCVDPEETPCSVLVERLDGREYRIALVGPGLRPGFGPVIVPEGRVFVLGDNRENSSDSRVWGGLPLGDVLGEVRFIWWSSSPDAGVRWDRINTQVR